MATLWVLVSPASRLHPTAPSTLYCIQALLHPSSTASRLHPTAPCLQPPTLYLNSTLFTGNSEQYWIDLNSSHNNCTELYCSILAELATFLFSYQKIVKQLREERAKSCCCCCCRPTQLSLRKLSVVKIDLGRLSSFSLIIFRKMYFSKFQNIFVLIAICICPDCKIHLSKLSESRSI